MFNPIQLLNSNNYAVYSRPIAKLLGSINAAILLSELIDRLTYYHRQGVIKKYDDKEWFFVTVVDMEERTVLTRDEQITAITILKNRGLISTKSMGLPAKRFFCVHEDALLKLMGVSKNKPVTTDSNIFYRTSNSRILENKIEIIMGNPENLDSGIPTVLNQRLPSKKLQEKPPYPLEKGGVDFSSEEQEQERQAKQLVDRMLEMLLLEKPNYVKPQQSYLIKMAKTLIINDKRTVEKCLNLIECCLRDEFYRQKMFRPNALSILRRQFDSLEIRFSPDEATRRLSPAHKESARDYCYRHFSSRKVYGDAWICTVGIGDIEFIRGAMPKTFFYESKTFFEELKSFLEKIGEKVPL